MRWVSRSFAVLVAVTLTVCAGGTAVSAKPGKPGSHTPAGPPIDPSQPCGFLTISQIQKQFGGPVTVDATNRGVNTILRIPVGCSFPVGTPPGSTGTLVTTAAFPSLFALPGQGSVDTVESLQATDSASGLNVQNLTLGKYSYVNISESNLWVSASKKFAFSIQWLAPGSPAQGGVLTPQVRKKLLVLAKAVLARSP